MGRRQNTCVLRYNSTPPKAGGPGVDKGLEKGAFEASMEGPLYCNSNHPTALKVTGIDAWIHLSRVKPSGPADDCGEWETAFDPERPLRLTIQRRRRRSQSPALTTLEAGQSMHS